MKGCWTGNSRKYIDFCCSTKDSPCLVDWLGFEWCHESESRNWDSLVVTRAKTLIGDVVMTKQHKTRKVFKPFREGFSFLTFS